MEVGEPVPDAEAMVHAAVAGLDRKVDADRERVEKTVRKHVDMLFRAARIKTFVGVLAERRA